MDKEDFREHIFVNSDKEATKEISIKKFEQDNYCKLISFKDLPLDLQEWLSIGKYFSKDYYLIYKQNIKSYDKIVVKLFTNDNEYSLHFVIPGEKNPDGYIGSYFKCRKSYPGENWHRGNDLSDGNYNKETFDKIMFDIILNELVEIKSKYLIKEN